MLDRHQLAAHEPDGKTEQHQREADLRQHVGEARAEGQADVGHQHLHHFVVGELDLDQHLFAADVVVEEVGPAQVGVERALQLARHDVEIFRRPERAHRSGMECHEDQHVRARMAQDPGLVLVVGKVGAQRDQGAQVAHQDQRQPVGHVVAALAVEPPRAQRLQQQHRHHDDDERAREQGLRRMPVGPARNTLEQVTDRRKLHASTSR